MIDIMSQHRVTSMEYAGHSTQGSSVSSGQPLCVAFAAGILGGGAGVAIDVDESARVSRGPGCWAAGSFAIRGPPFGVTDGRSPNRCSGTAFTGGPADGCAPRRSVDGGLPADGCISRCSAERALPPRFVGRPNALNGRIVPGASSSRHLYCQEECPVAAACAIVVRNHILQCLQGSSCQITPTCRPPTRIALCVYSLVYTRSLFADTNNMK